MYKEWKKSKNDAWIGGVLGGLANYLNIDPTLVRILYLVLWASTVGIPLGLMYVILWIILPEE